MNKTELIAAVAEKSGISKKDAEKAVTTTFDTITEALSQGDKVQLVGFGGFETKKREARMGRNPKTKEEYDLPWGGKLQFYSAIVGGAIDARFMPAILKGIMEKMDEGPLTGSYARDIRVVIYDGKMTRSIPAQIAALAINVYPLKGTVDAVEEDGRWHLTPKGFMLSNSILVELLEAQQKSRPLTQKK